MKRALLCCCPLLVGASATGEMSSIMGTVSGAPMGAVLHIHAYQVPDHDAITKEDVYFDLDRNGTTATAQRVNVSRTIATADGSFYIPALSSVHYTLFAWADVDLDGRLDLPYEPVGWFATGGAHWMTPVKVNGADPISIRVTGPAPMPSGTLSIANAHLHSVAGLRTLSVAGSPRERGHAHGFLLGQQIIDFFRFFTLQSTTNSTSFYTSQVVPFVNSSTGWYNYSAEYLEEIDAILHGIRQSNLNNGLWLEELGRNLERADLLYLNDYGNYPEAPQTLRRACTQFAFWGDASATGRLIAGRNMDGENDFRRVTVSHFIAFSVTPDNGASPFVHFMWPGFVAVASGVSTRGLWVMMNDGQSDPNGPLARGISPFGWVVRQMLSGAPSIRSAKEVAEQHRSDRGGTCSAGCNLMVAAATGADGSASGADGEGSEGDRDLPPPQAVVLESDRAHNAWRAPLQVQPLISQGIMTTNHEFLPPAYDPRAPLDNWGRQVYFSSLWRYEAGKNLVNVYAEYGVKIGLAEMKRLLQTATHATTEHTIVLQDAGSEGLILHVAVADLRIGGWHAPYLQWHRAEISRFFEAPVSPTLKAEDPQPAAAPSPPLREACARTNTTYLALKGVCIHSDHSGMCGQKGEDTRNAALDSGAECKELCCANRDICAAFLWYSAYASTSGNCTAGAPCCWLKSAVSPAHRWTNDPYCSEAGVVYISGPL